MGLFPDGPLGVGTRLACGSAHGNGDAETATVNKTQKRAMRMVIIPLVVNLLGGGKESNSQEEANKGADRTAILWQLGGAPNGIFGCNYNTRLNLC